MTVINACQNDGISARASVHFCDSLTSVAVGHQRCLLWKSVPLLSTRMHVATWVYATVVHRNVRSMQLTMGMLVAGVPAVWNPLPTGTGHGMLNNMGAASACSIQRRFS